jgi:parallel beta-helix repeat protein
MKLTQKTLLFITVLGITFIFSAITISIVLREIGSPSEISRSIEIYGNSGWFNAKDEGIVTGSGTYSDPYVIEDLIIIDSEAPIGINIKNSDVHFKIENCTISNYYRGINLYNVSNARLINNNCSLNKENGIYISNSYNTTIHGNIASDNSYTHWGIFYRGHGIIVEESNDITLSENTANSNAYGIKLEESNNITISGNNLNSNDYGIGVYSSNHSIVSGNKMSKCGLGIDEPIGKISSLNIDENNLVYFS